VVAVGTYGRTYRVKLVFAGHAQGKRRNPKLEEDRNVSFVSVLVMQIDWQFVQFICGSCHKTISYQTL